MPITYQQTAITINRTRTTTPTLTPITIHFQFSLLLGSTGFCVGDVVVVAVNKAFTSEMFAPMASSSSGLLNTIILSSVMPGSTETLPIKSPRGCCT